MLVINILAFCCVLFIKMNFIVALRVNTNKMLKLNHQSRYRYLIKGFMASKSSDSTKATTTSSTVTNNDAGNTPFTIRVAYQGEPGAYSEKAARELLGPRVTTGE